MITTSKSGVENPVSSLSSSHVKNPSRYANLPGSTSTIPPSLFSERVKYLNDYARLATNNPLCAITLTVVMFSIAGIPPLAGFYSKTFLIFAAIGSANYVLSILAIAMSVISAFYYIRIVKIMYFEPNMPLPVSRTQKNANAISNQSTLDLSKNSTGFSTNLPLDRAKKPLRLLSPSLKKEFAYTMLSFTRISKEVSLVCALSFCFLLFFSMHPKPIFLITQKALLLCT